MDKVLKTVRKHYAKLRSQTGLQGICLSYDKASAHKSNIVHYCIYEMSRSSNTLHIFSLSFAEKNAQCNSVCTVYQGQTTPGLSDHD